MNDKCIDNIKNFNFDDVLVASKNFALKTNGIFIKTTHLNELIVENYFPETRVRLKKECLMKCIMMKHLLTQNINSKLEVFQSILEQLLPTTMKERFDKLIIADMQYLLPKHCDDIKNKLIPVSALNQLSILSSVNRSKLMDELEHFAEIYT